MTKVLLLVVMCTGIRSVLGCPCPNTPEHSVMLKMDTRMTIYCLYSDDKWDLVCSGDQWKGIVGTCPASEQAPTTTATAPSTASNTQGQFIMKQEICETETFNPNCPDGTNIQIKGALYGRMRLGRCVKADLGYVGCSSNVTQFVESLCSGKQTCTLSLPHQALESSSCMDELKSYLEVAYYCSNTDNGLSTIASTAQPATESPVHIQDICSWETFSPKCPDDTQIMINAAAYGRMTLGRCINIDYGYIGCSADVHDIVSKECSGKSTCSIPVPSDSLHSLHSCPKDLPSYLNVRYTCINKDSATMTSLPTSAAPVTQESCNSETFNATCPPGETVKIHSAKYGRMRLSRCININYGHIGCGNDVVSYMDKLCAGKPSCNLGVPVAGLESRCPEGFPVYLEVSYSCE